MPRNAAGDAELRQLRRRVEELERRLERQGELLAEHEALLRRRRTVAPRRGRPAGTPCAHCEDGILRCRGQQLVCSACDYERYL